MTDHPMHVGLESILERATAERERLERENAALRAATPSATDLYTTIREALLRVADVRATRERYNAETARELFRLADEMAREAAHRLVWLFPIWSDRHVAGDGPASVEAAS